MHYNVSRTFLHIPGCKWASLPIIFLYEYLLLPPNPERVKFWEVTGLCQHTKEAPAVRCFLPEAISAPSCCCIRPARSSTWSLAGVQQILLNTKKLTNRKPSRWWKVLLRAYLATSRNKWLQQPTSILSECFCHFLFFFRFPSVPNLLSSSLDLAHRH